MRQVWGGQTRNTPTASGSPSRLPRSEANSPQHRRRSESVAVTPLTKKRGGRRQRVDPEQEGLEGPAARRVVDEPRPRRLRQARVVDNEEREREDAQRVQPVLPLRGCIPGVHRAASFLGDLSRGSRSLQPRPSVVHGLDAAGTPRRPSPRPAGLVDPPTLSMLHRGAFHRGLVRTARTF
jgi:hypothetical protein